MWSLKFAEYLRFITWKTIGGFVCVNGLFLSSRPDWWRVKRIYSQWQPSMQMPTPLAPSTCGQQRPTHSSIGVPVGVCRVLPRLGEQAIVPVDVVGVEAQLALLDVLLDGGSRLSLVEGRRDKGWASRFTQNWSLWSSQR